MILSKMLKLMEYVHAVLLLALLIPLVYAVGKLVEPSGTLILYFKCLLIFVPIVITDQAAKCIKSLTLYFLACIALTVGIAGITGPFVYFVKQRDYLELNELCYFIGMTVETVLIAIKRFRDRLRQAESRKNDNPLAEPAESILNTPSLTFVWYFVVIYIFGILFYSKMLCDLAFFSAIIYFFLALAYAYFETTSRYFMLNKRTKGIPKRRLYSISAGMIAGFSMLVLIGIVPSVLLLGQRYYTDIRTWGDNIKLKPYEFEYEMQFQGATDGRPEWVDILNDGKPAPKPSKIVNIICSIVAVICCTCFIYGVIQAIRQVFRNFRSGLDDNGDKIEEIDIKDNIFGEEALQLGSYNDNQIEKVRRRYRKMIRKYRKDKPAVFEAPIEIEELAGLKDNEEMQALHKEYERARYGQR